MKQLIVILLVAVMTIAQTSGESDSLRQELEAITRKLESLEREKLEAKRLQLEEELRLRNALEPAKDTIIVVDTIIVNRGEEYEKSRTEEVLLEINRKLAKSKRSGFGGGGGPVMGGGAFSVAPVNELVANDITHKASNSAFYGLNYKNAVKGNYETFFIMGGFGFGGLGDGIRIGGGGYSADRSYTLIPNSPLDSTKELKIDIGYGGVILEKAWNKDKTTIVLGTLLGAGSYSVELNNEDYSYNIDEDYDFTDESAEFKSSAGFFAGELRGSATISLTSWFHLGLEGFALLTASSSGFQYGDGFATFNGGGRLRILFGNLG